MPYLSSREVKKHNATIGLIDREPGAVDEHHQNQLQPATETREISVTMCLFL